MQQYFEQIQQRYGMVRRARGFYLYTEKGVRLIDMCLDCARSVLGRREGQVNLVLKQKTDKGFHGFFPTQANYVLEKTCRKIFPDYTVTVFSNVKNAFEYVRLINQAINGTALRTDSETREYFTWRPFAAGTKEYLRDMPAFLYPPPFACTAALALVRKTVSSQVIQDTYATVEQEEIPQAMLFVIAKSLSSLLSNAPEYEQSMLHHPVLQLFSEFFNVEGIYLKPQKNESDAGYAALFDYFLEHKILISPNRYIPSVFPKLEQYRELENAVKQYRM